jgi:HK97 family phage major capsid protein
MNMIEMKRTRAEALAKAEAILTTAEQRGGAMTAPEQENYRTSMSEFEALSCSIGAREKVNTVKNLLGNGANILLGTPDADAPAVGSPLALAAARKPEYSKALYGYLRAGGKVVTDELLSGADGDGGFHLPGSESFTRQRLANGSFPKFQAATYEGSLGGSDAAGGYAVSIPTEQLIVPLAMPDLGIFDAATVIPTNTDLKVPQQAAFGTSAQKAESTGTVATFGGTDPTLGQVSLTAFMVGALRLASWELLQDVQAFQQFIVDDLIKGQRILEGSLLASGNGTTQPLGVFGNTGTGTGAAYELLGTSADGQTLLNSLFDVTAQLKGQYQAGAVWIMSRATGLAIRRAQMQANLFIPVATVDPDGTERILGKPVFYDLNSPALPTATSAGVVPILYGDLKAGYLIGVRGGAGINVKVLDQPWAAQGQLGILAYRRLDGRVRRSEAMQAITISHS